MGVDIACMVEMRRWGKKYVDRRNWKEYNESLVRRGEIPPRFRSARRVERGG